MATYKQMANDQRFIKLSDGNLKLMPNKKTAFLIWNLSAVTTCPFATDHCKASCYALKAERCYPSARKSRKEHFEISKCQDSAERMIYTISTEMARPKNNGKEIIFRIHESGDFYNKEYAEKWLTIARHFVGSPIKFVAYTKSVRYFDGVDLPSNFYLLASVWDDTTEENLEIIHRNGFKIYTAFSGEDLTEALNNGYTLCRCKDCATCGKCWNKKVGNTVCEIH